MIPVSLLVNWVPSNGDAWVILVLAANLLPPIVDAEEGKEESGGSCSRDAPLAIFLDDVRRVC
jgi:hypothetical protein